MGLSTKSMTPSESIVKRERERVRATLEDTNYEGDDFSDVRLKRRMSDAIRDETTPRPFSSDRYRRHPLHELVIAFYLQNGRRCSGIITLFVV